MIRAPNHKVPKWLSLPDWILPRTWARDDVWDFSINIHWARNVGMNGNPWTSKYGGEAAPKTVPHRSLMGWAYECWCAYSSAWPCKETGEMCCLWLKTTEKIDKGEEKRHTVEYTSNREDRTLILQLIYSYVTRAEPDKKRILTLFQLNGRLGWYHCVRIVAKYQVRSRTLSGGGELSF